MCIYISCPVYSTPSKSTAMRFPCHNSACVQSARQAYVALWTQNNGGLVFEERAEELVLVLS